MLSNAASQHPSVARAISLAGKRIHEELDIKKNANFYGLKNDVSEMEALYILCSKHLCDELALASKNLMSKGKIKSSFSFEVAKEHLFAFDQTNTSLEGLNRLCADIKQAAFPYYPKTLAFQIECSFAHDELVCGVLSANSKNPSKLIEFERILDKLCDREIQAFLKANAESVQLCAKADPTFSIFPANSLKEIAKYYLSLSMPIRKSWKQDAFICTLDDLFDLLGKAKSLQSMIGKYPIQGMNDDLEETVRTASRIAGKSQSNKALDAFLHKYGL